MNKLALKLGLSAAASAIAAAAVFAVWKRSRASDTIAVQIVDPQEVLRSSVAHRSDAQPASVAEAAREIPAAAWRLARRPLSRQELETLFPGHTNHTEYDLVSHFRIKPNSDLLTKFEEHPQGEFHKLTNSLGLVSDREVREQRPESRVLVIGDSHAAGVCGYRESFAGHLEDLLVAKGRDAEVLNASCGGYSFYQYLGALERTIDLAPHVLVLAVYGGNDFDVALGAYYYFAGTPRPWKPGIERDALVSGGQIHNGAVFQAFSALAYFSHHPEQVDVALAIARDATADIATLCARNSITPLVMYIPSAVEVEWAPNAELFGQLKQHFKLEDADIARGGELGDRYLASVRELGLETLDLREHFADPAAKYYWRSDFHLALDGHRVAAEQLAARVLALAAPK